MPIRKAHRPVCGLLLAASLACAAEEDTGVKQQPRKLPAISILPHGSVLQGVMLPRYDENRLLVSSLKIGVMTLVNDERVDGEDVAMEMYNTDGSSKVRIRLAHAVLDQTSGFLTATESVNVVADGLIANGSGIRYHLEQEKGFLIGPVETHILAPIETTMHSTTPLRATAALGVALLTVPLTAAPPAAISEQELADLRTDASTKSAEVAEKTTETAQSIATDASDAKAASEAATEFLKKANLPAPGAAADQEAKPLEVPADPNNTLIECDGGMFFDAEAGVLVYMKNVRVTDPRFNLTGADELKIFFAKKPEEEKPANEEEEAAEEGFGAGFGDVDRIIATGAVRILQKATKPGDDPVEASGGLFTYRINTGEIIISGRYPWVKQGTYFARAKEPQLTLRILKSGEFVTEGRWDMGGNLNLNR